MTQGVRVWDAGGVLMFDSDTDRVAGGIQQFSTGTADGSYTLTPDYGQSVEWVYQMPGSWSPSGSASRWPTINVSGNSISWSFNSTVPTAQRMTVSILGITY